MRTRIHPRKTSRDSYNSRKLQRERTRRSLERYHGRIALMQTWEHIDKQYYQRLKMQAHKLREQLIVKGAL